MRTPFILTALLTLCTLTASAQEFAPQIVATHTVNGVSVREIRDFSYTEAAAATCDDQGPIVIFNPMLMQDLTPGVIRWVRAHEYAHIALGHVYSTAKDSLERIAREDAADSVATLAMMDRPKALIEVVNHLLRQGDVTDGAHSNQQARARHIIVWMREFGGYDVVLEDHDQRKAARGSM